jgi:hypothetical protein
MTFTRYFVILVKRRKVRKMIDYAQQLGYERDLDLLFDFYNVENLHNLVETIIYNISATHEIEEVIQDLVKELVESTPNLMADCKRRE